jgi:hypothetical protein
VGGWLPGVRVNNQEREAFERRLRKSRRKSAASFLRYLIFEQPTVADLPERLRELATKVRSTRRSASGQQDTVLQEIETALLEMLTEATTAGG